eukprot:1153297-Pelagomonas_calceolata.AAC.12
MSITTAVSNTTRGKAYAMRCNPQRKETLCSLTFKRPCPISLFPLASRCTWCATSCTGGAPCRRSAGTPPTHTKSAGRLEGLHSVLSTVCWRSSTRATQAAHATSGKPGAPPWQLLL